MNVEWRQASAKFQTKPTIWAASPPVQAGKAYTHHHHLLLFLSPTAYTHFTIPWMVEG